VTDGDDIPDKSDRLGRELVSIADVSDSVPQAVEPSPADEALPVPTRSEVEDVKEESRHLRGSIAADLADPSTGTVGHDSQVLIKFHGIYAQDDRDQRRERSQRKVELAHIFMVRASVPGGLLTADQWLAMDALSDEVADGTLRLTTRQGVQFHGVAKAGLIPLVRALNERLVTTLGACGDVVRNTMCCPAPMADDRQARLLPATQALANRFRPQTHAYAEVWLDGEKAATIEERHTGAAATIEESRADAPADAETIFGDTYLPRKFKITVAWPGDNCVDVYAQDLGVVPAVHPEHGDGYVLLVGGGLGMNHAHEGTYPRLGTPLAWVSVNDLGDVAEAVVVAFRDHGDRADRKRARLKYLIDDMGLPWFRAEVERILGRPLLAAVELPEWEDIHDHLGWNRQPDAADRSERWFLGVHVPSGRVRDGHRAAFREIVERFRPTLRVTPNQDLLITDIAASDRAEVDAVLAEYGVVAAERMTPTARHALACPALPTCGQALGEAERIMPNVLAVVEGELAARGLCDEGLLLRVTGCPNGCARPYTAELGLVGRTKTGYDVYVGGSAIGTRLGGVVQRSVKIADLAGVIGPLLDKWRDDRAPGETFGDFTHRIGADAAGLRG
jgi:sulfite reductase (ferredoxin)